MKHIPTVIVGFLAVAALLIGVSKQDSVDGVVFGAQAGPTFTEPIEIQGGLTYGATLSTSTTDTAMTLVWGLVKNKRTIVVMPQTGDLTYTFAASSTDRSFLPKTGDLQETCFVNATSTPQVDVIFAAGTGIDLQVASSSATAIGALNIAPESVGCFTFVRQHASSSTFDITAAFTTFVNGD